MAIKIDNTIMKLNHLRKIIADNINSGSFTVAYPEGDLRVKIELLKWPLQETPSITILIENLDLTINGDVGILKTVNFTTDPNSHNSVSFKNKVIYEIERAEQTKLNFGY